MFDVRRDVEREENGVADAKWLSGGKTSGSSLDVLTRCHWLKLSLLQTSQSIYYIKVLIFKRGTTFKLLKYHTVGLL